MGYNEQNVFLSTSSIELKGQYPFYGHRTVDGSHVWLWCVWDYVQRHVWDCVCTHQQEVAFVCGETSVFTENVTSAEFRRGESVPNCMLFVSSKKKKRQELRGKYTV